MVLGGPAPARADPAWVRRRRLHVLFAVACLGSLASALLMVLQAPNGYTSRAYYGTDTRAQALLVGAAIAIGLALWREGSSRPWFTRTASVLALAGVAGDGGAVGHDVGDLDVRLQWRVPVGQPGGGRDPPRLHGGAAFGGGPPPGTAAPAARRSDLLRHLSLVLARRSRHDGATAAPGRLPALPGLRPPSPRPSPPPAYELVEMPIRRGASTALLAILGGGARRGGHRH